MGLILKSFVIELVSATVADATRCWQQTIDKVGTTVLYINEKRIVATISALVCRLFINADFPQDFTLSHCRMIIFQPGRVTSTTFVDRWTCGHHFPPCISLETIPTIEVAVTFGLTFCIGAIFSLWVCQINVLGTYNWNNKYT